LLITSAVSVGVLMPEQTVNTTCPHCRCLVAVPYEWCDGKWQNLWVCPDCVTEVYSELQNAEPPDAED
jgi:hypothetical protein